MKCLEIDERSLPIAEKVFKEHDEEMVYCYYVLADQYKTVQNFEKATIMLERVVQWRIKFYGATHEAVGMDLMNLASAHTDLGRFEDASRLQQKAAKIMQAGETN